ncbi:ABC transporter permease subunit [Alicyclobacillus tolerans]|uniref:ABC transporter permease subunit n=1 Tax=Alicyclobacillus tolerans TaxID=90970 RepID=UPI003B7D37DC
MMEAERLRRKRNRRAAIVSSGMVWLLAVLFVVIILLVYVQAGTSLVWLGGRAWPDFFMVMEYMGLLFGSLCFSIPFAFFLAVYYKEYRAVSTSVWLQYVLQIWAGLPGVLFSYVLGVIIFQRTQGHLIVALFLAAWLYLIPHLSQLWMASLARVPESEREGALALGIRRMQIVWHLLLPSTKNWMLGAAGIVYLQSLADLGLWLFITPFFQKAGPKLGIWYSQLLLPHLQQQERLGIWFVASLFLTIHLLTQIFVRVWLWKFRKMSTMHSRFFLNVDHE